MEKSINPRNNTSTDFLMTVTILAACHSSLERLLCLLEWHYFRQDGKADVQSSMRYTPLPKIANYLNRRPRERESARENAKSAAVWITSSARLLGTGAGSSWTARRTGSLPAGSGETASLSRGFKVIAFWKANNIYIMYFLFLNYW